MGGLGQFADLKGDLAKKRGMVLFFFFFFFFLGGGYPMHTLFWHANNDIALTSNQKSYFLLLSHYFIFSTIIRITLLVSSLKLTIM